MNENDGDDGDDGARAFPLTSLLKRAPSKSVVECCRR